MIGERISCQPPLALSIRAVTGAQTAFSKGQDGRGFVVKRAPCQGWCSLTRVLLLSWRAGSIKAGTLEARMFHQILIYRGAAGEWRCTPSDGASLFRS